MRFKNLDLLVIMLIVALNVAWTQVPSQFKLAGIIFALPLILFLPGYTLAQTLFRKRAPEQGQQGAFTNRPDLSRPDFKVGHPIGGTDQIVMGLGLSLAVDVLVGFTLNILPIGLAPLSWILSLGLFTTIFALLAAFLRSKDISTPAKKSRIRVGVQDILLFGLAILVVCSAVWFSLIRPTLPQTSFTQFWLLPADPASGACSVSLGVQSFENTSETYRVVMSVNNAQTNTWSSIVLAPQQKWVQMVAVAPAKAQSGTLASSIAVAAQLYLVNKPGAVYRDVHLVFYLADTTTNGQTQQRCLVDTKH